MSFTNLKIKFSWSKTQNKLKINRLPRQYVCKLCLGAAKHVYGYMAKKCSIII